MKKKQKYYGGQINSVGHTKNLPENNTQGRTLTFVLKTHFYITIYL